MTSLVFSPLPKQKGANSYIEAELVAVMRAFMHVLRHVPNHSTENSSKTKHVEIVDGLFDAGVDMARISEESKLYPRVATGRRGLRNFRKPRIYFQGTS